MAQAATSHEHLTDLGNAMRLVAQHGVDIRYCGAWKSWLFWDGLRWNEDETGEVERRAKGTARGIYREAAGVSDLKHFESIVRWAQQSESEARIRAMINLAKTEPGIPARVDDLDADPWLLGVKNGTLDLRTGDVRPACRDDLITKLAPVEYNPAAVCPVWDRFLSEIMDGNQQMVQFLQRAVGYSLTAHISERVLFILYGEGANGKTTFLETIRDLLGAYAEVTSADTLLVKRVGTIPNDLAALKGARFALASEAEQGRRLAEAQVKPDDRWRHHPCPTVVRGVVQLQAYLQDLARHQPQAHHPQRQQGHMGPHQTDTLQGSHLGRNAGQGIAEEATRRAGWDPCLGGSGLPGVAEMRPGRSGRSTGGDGWLSERDGRLWELPRGVLCAGARCLDHDR